MLHPARYIHFIGTFININNCQLALTGMVASALAQQRAKSFCFGFCLTNYLAYTIKLIDNV